MYPGAKGLALACALALLAIPTPGAYAGGEGSPVRLLPVIGQPRWVQVLEGDTLVDMAHRERVGFDALARLNPEVRVWVPRPGTRVELPTWQILPDASLDGLVVNLPEMRLYDYTAPAGLSVYAVAVGDAADPSPLGRYRVGDKTSDPTWRVPASIRLARPELPPLVRPGPDNPLGSRWMRIGASSYGIHGTNLPWSIGRQATHGCVRLYEPDMQDLYARVPSGTPIEMIYQTVKLGRRGSTLFVEAHPDLYGRDPEPAASTLERLERAGLGEAIDAGALRRAVREARGIPVAVGTLPDPEPMRLAGVAPGS